MFRFAATPTHKELATIDAQLKSSGVQMRSISLASNGQIGDLNAPINVRRRERARAHKAKVKRLAFFSRSMFDASARVLCK